MLRNYQTGNAHLEVVKLAYVRYFQGYGCGIEREWNPSQYYNIPQLPGSAATIVFNVEQIKRCNPPEIETYWTSVSAAFEPTLDEKGQLFISDLGWTKLEALQIRLQLKSFEDDWNAPGMEAYDKL